MNGRSARSIRLLSALVLPGLLGLFLAGPRGGFAGETLQPAFPNYAAVMPDASLKPQASSLKPQLRASPSGPVTPELPFSWTQVVVTHENTINLRIVNAYDPGLQPVQIEFLPVSPVNLTIQGFDAQRGLMQAEVLPKTGGQIENLQFRVRARDVISDDLFTLSYDIRGANTRVRGTPLLLRSPGDVIKPGQMVRYTWNQAARGEKRPKVEAEFSGRTGAAKGLVSSTITEVLATKFQPYVLGHYLMTVTPRDVRGEPARGSTSNGQVFLCAFGSENLPPVTDGLAADNFLPAVGQTVYLNPVAVDPETGRSTFDGQTYDFGDGVVQTGVSGTVAHAFAAPGIYTVRCTVADDQGLAATTQDNVIVGATLLDKLTFKFTKNIPPAEAGVGEPDLDSLSVSFRDVGAKAGDRIVFVYNRNRFGRLFSSDAGDDTDIVLGPGGGFTGATRLAKTISVLASGSGLTINVTKANFDRTGDPRFGRSDIKGIFRNQRIAVCVVPADGSTPRVFAFAKNMQVKVTGGAVVDHFTPEEKVRGSATDKEPNPRTQEAY